MRSALPLHPTRRHPLTGARLRAIWIRPDGRVMWPILGGDDTHEPAGGPDAAAAATAAAAASAAAAAPVDQGFPKDTPVVEMSAEQQAAYWKHHSRQHEGRYKELLGDKKPEDLKNDLAELARIRQEQQTPAEQALTAAREEGKREAIVAERRNTAEALFKGALQSAGIKDGDLAELTASFNVDSFITDTGVDSSKITNFAKRFSTTGSDTDQNRRRNFGGGNRGGTGGTPVRGDRGKAEAERRFAKAKAKSGE
jgi:hypothetical protein